MAPLDPPRPSHLADTGFGKLTDERNAIRRMVEEDRAENGEPPWASVHATPNGERFYLYCRDRKHQRIRGIFTDKAVAGRAAERHNALHREAP